MDSTNPQSGPSSSLRSNRKRKSNTPRMGKSKKAKFLDTYVHQRFSLPPSIMHYVAKNPSTSEVYQNLVESCKYFFVQNKNLVISRLLHYGDHWRVNNGRKPFDLNKIKRKYWISDKLHVGPKDWKSDIAGDQNIVSSIIPKLYRCDAKRLTFINQVISFHNMSFLISSAEYIFFKNVTVKNDNDENVGIENILEVAVKTKIIILWDANVTSKTMEEFIKLPHFTKLDEMIMTDISNTFDLEAFYGYMKTNKRTKFWLCFDNSISDEYKNRLDEIIDEILSTKSLNFNPAYIDFGGLAEEKRKKLYRLYRSY